MPESSVKERYELYLQSDHWRGLRQLAFKEYGKQCELCSAKPLSLHIHHIYYRELVDVTLDDLIVVCQRCHDRIHKFLSRHHGSLRSRTKLLKWSGNNKKHYRAQKKARKNRKTGVRIINRLVGLQRKHGKNYVHVQLQNARGFFQPFSWPKPLKPAFHSFSEGEYSQPREIGIAQLIENAVGTRLIPAGSIQTQVSPQTLGDTRHSLN